MAVLTEHVSHMKKEDLSSHLVQLQGFFLTCLDIQSQLQVNVSHLSRCNRIIFYITHVNVYLHSVNLFMVLILTLYRA